MTARTYDEKQKLDSIWPLSIFTINIVFNWLLYFKLGHEDINFFYISVLTIGLLCLFLSRMALVTQMDDLGIHYQFKPIHRKMKTIPWNDIEKLEIVRFNAFKDYGGWGLRSNKNGKAVIIKGSDGLKITLKNQRHVLLGSNQTQAIKAYLEDRKISMFTRN